MAVARALGIYRASVVPRVRREQRRWLAVAERIPDPDLRASARGALTGKALNVEAVAVFATLAPRAARGLTVEAIVALQIAIDYIDTLGEQPSADPLADGLQLHRALAVALTPAAEPADWYRLHPRREDGGYLSQLVAACQQRLRQLPASAAVLPLARAAAERCGEGQSHTHAEALGEPGALERWATGLGGPADYRWWELAAGASSSVAAHALLVAAADPRTSAAEAELIDAAYFPSVGALTVLLDDLIDLEEDRASADHNYVGHYPSGDLAADRLAWIAARAAAAQSKLRRPQRHAAILAGVVGFYLGAPESERGFARPARQRLLAASGPSTQLLVATMRRRRTRKRPRGTGIASGP
jgi:tetraprenyl-beta-curcumene synthase